MTASTPFVSVIVLTHNRLSMLKGAVETLLHQDYPPDAFEIIVVNDGSSDGTRTWLDQQSDQRIRAVHQAALGIPSARNAGIRAAKGDLIAIVADDYLLAPDYVSTFVDFLQSHPDARIVRFGIVPSDRWPGSLLSHFYYDLSFRKRLLPHAWPKSASRREKLRTYFQKLPDTPETISTDHRLEAAGAAAFRRDIFDEVGLFDEQLKRAEDTDLSHRLRERGIAIYYNPHHKIRHRYGRWGGDTLKKSYESGIYAARLHVKLRAQAGPDAPVSQGLLYRILLLFWRFRQAGLLKSFVLWPGIVLFEGAWQAGYLQEKTRRAFRRTD